MAKGLLLIAAGTFLTFTAITWGYVFSQVIRYGSYNVYEPVRSTLVAEFTLAIVLACLGIVGLIYGLIKE